MQITSELLSQYFSGKRKRASYEDAKKQYDILRAHTNGEFPHSLIGSRRPSETEEIFRYRKQIYEPVTMEPVSSIIRSLGKIRRSSDWTIKYEDAKISSSIAEGEELRDYCELNFPYFGSVTNWVFNLLLKNLLIDTNAVVLVMPLNENAESHEYLQPFPIIYNSDQVYEFIPNQLAILLSTEQTADIGKIFFVVDAESKTIKRYEQKARTNDYALLSEFEYNFDCFPAFRLPGIFVKLYGTNDMLSFSHIQPIVPRLNEAAREYSDMQAEVVQHIYSEKWEYHTQKCEECLDAATGISTGKIKAGNGKRIITCTKCNGTGWMGSSPYKKIGLRPVNKNMGEPEIPIPPAGYIQKQIDIVKLQDTRIDAHIYKALTAINMQFLAQTPLNESGYAKEIDRDELNNFVYGIAEDLVKVMDDLYLLINEYRYATIIPSCKLRAQQLPHIPVPEKFDLLSTSTLMDELKDVRNSQAAPIIIMAHEIDYAAKKFYAQPEVKNELIAVMTLDPLPATNDNEKFVRLQGGGITKLDYIISCNILPFVKRAIFEDEDFYTQPLNQQKEKMQQYANELLVSIKADEQSIKDMAAAKAGMLTKPVSLGDGE